MAYNTCSDKKVNIPVECENNPVFTFRVEPHVDMFIICPITGSKIQVLGINENGEYITLDML